MEGMHDSAWPRRASQDGCQTCNSPSFRRVRVQYIGPEIANEAQYLVHGADIRANSDVALKRWSENGNDPFLSNSVFHRSFLRANSSGDERSRVSAFVQPTGQIRDMQRWTAYVQARDHSQDTDRIGHRPRISPASLHRDWGRSGDYVSVCRFEYGTSGDARQPLACLRARRNSNPST